MEPQPTNSTPNRRRTAAGLAVGTIAVAGTTGVTGLLLARLMTPADRGIYALAVLWPTIISVPFTLGLRNAVVYWDAHQEVELRRLPSTALTGATISSVLLLLSGLLWVRWVTPWALPTWIVLAALPAVTIGGVWTGIFQARELGTWNRLRVLTPVLYLIGISLAAVTLTISPAIAATAFLLSHVLVLAYSYLIARSRGWTGESGFSRDTAKHLYSYGSRASVSTLAEVANSRLDWAILGFIVDESDFGTYVVAANLTFLLTPVLSFLAPSIVPEVAGRTDGSMRRFVGHSIRTTIFLSVIAVGAMWLLAPAVPILLGDKWDASVPIIRILAPGALLLALRSVLNQVAQARGRPAVAAISDLAAAALNVVLLLVFAPAFGVIGAAWISVLTYFVNVALVAVALRRNPARSKAHASQEQS